MTLAKKVMPVEGDPYYDYESPCVRTCVIDQQSQFCIGCGRTRMEIAGWLGMQPQERRGIMTALPERVSTMTQRKTRRGGRRGKLAGA